MLSRTRGVALACVQAGGPGREGGEKGAQVRAGDGKASALHQLRLRGHWLGRRVTQERGARGAQQQ